MSDITNEQAEWLVANRTMRGERARWAYTSNAAPMLDEMIDAGIVKPAYGEMIVAPPASPSETINILGKTIPVMNMISLYMLTQHGERMLSDFEARGLT